MEQTYLLFDQRNLNKETKLFFHAFRFKDQMDSFFKSWTSFARKARLHHLYGFSTKTLKEKERKFTTTHRGARFSTGGFLILRRQFYRTENFLISVHMVNSN